MPRRPALPSEKIMAVAGTYKALAQELHAALDQHDVRVQVALLQSATTIAMYTDTRDLGLLAQPEPQRPTDAGEHFAFPCDDCGWIEGHDPSVEH